MQTNSKRKIAVTGLGVVSAVGNDIPSFWQALNEGRSGIGPVTRFDASRLESRIAGEVKNFDPSPWIDRKEARKMGLFTQFAVSAAVQAWRDAGFPDGPEGCAPGTYDRDRVGVVLGNGIGGIEVMVEAHAKMLESGPDRMPPMTVPLMIANEAAGNVAIRFGIHGPALTQVTACASGTDAIGQALDLLRAGRIDVALAGGTEASITEFAMGGFCRLKALSAGRNDTPQSASRPFDRDRDGFVIGEGAGMMVLEDYDTAKARGARIYAVLAGYGATCDAFHLTAPDPEGSGGTKAIGFALADGGLLPADIVYYNAHGTSTQINDPTETKMVKAAFKDHAPSLKISSTKSMTGHCLGAAGAIEAIVCVKAIETGMIPPTINLDNPDLEAGCDLDYVPNKGVRAEVKAAMSASLGFGGHNGVVVFTKP